jgi:thiol-disulfide isomerase/thioredoxin
VKKDKKTMEENEDFESGDGLNISDTIKFPEEALKRSGVEVSGSHNGNREFAVNEDKKLGVGFKAGLVKSLSSSSDGEGGSAEDGNGSAEKKKKSKVEIEKISALYKKAQSDVESDLSKEEKFFRILGEIVKEMEKLRGKPRMRWLRFLLTAIIVGIGIFIMFIPDKQIVGRSIFEFNPPSGFYVEAGKYVVVNFFASWCDPCIDEIPELVEFAKNAENFGASIVGVVVNDSDENIMKLAEKTGINYPVVFDNSHFFENLGFKAIPVTLIVGPDTKIKKVFFGQITKEKIESYIKLLQDKAKNEKK